MQNNRVCTCQSQREVKNNQTEKLCGLLFVLAAQRAVAAVVASEEEKVLPVCFCVLPLDHQVNASPSLTTTTKADRLLKFNVINDTLNTVAPATWNLAGNAGTGSITAAGQQERWAATRC